MDLASRQNLSPPSGLVCHLILAPLVFHRFLGFQLALPSPALPGGQPGPWYPWSLLVRGIHALLCLPGLLLDQQAPEVPGWWVSFENLAIFSFQDLILRKPALLSLPWTGYPAVQLRCQALEQRLPPLPGHHHQYHYHYCTLIIHVNILIIFIISMTIFRNPPFPESVTYLENVSSAPCQLHSRQKIKYLFI